MILTAPIFKSIGLACKLRIDKTSVSKLRKGWVSTNPLNFFLNAESPNWNILKGLDKLSGLVILVSQKSHKSWDASVNEIGSPVIACKPNWFTK